MSPLLSIQAVIFDLDGLLIDSEPIYRSAWQAAAAASGCELYIWARTVRCESPNCGAETPPVRSFWLSKKASRRRALRYGIVRPKGKPPQVEFEVFSPKSESGVPEGTVSLSSPPLAAQASC